MLKVLSIPLLSTALALSPMAATPARANDDLGKILAGVALLAIIGSAVSNSQASSPPPAPAHPPRGHAAKRPLPQECRHDVRDRGRTITVYGKQCLQRNVRGRVRLPDICEREMSVFGRDRDVYTAHCLRRHGWPV